jgi:hypothetical protein
VADALKIPMALGEQEPSTHNFRWVLANNAVGIVQQDMFLSPALQQSFTSQHASAV